jgi:hypothetical protein
MQFRHVAPALIACALLLAFAGSSSSATLASPVEQTVGSLRVSSSAVAEGGDLSRYEYLILNAWEAGRIAALKAANPRLKVLVYKNAIASRSDACRSGADDALLSTGVGYCWADVNQPAWFLTDTASRRIEFCDYGGAWMMDMGNSGYQSRWASNVSAELRARGWDGVFVDDVNPYQSYHLCGRTLAKYPTESSQAAATRSFLASVAPAIRSGGHLVIANIPSTTMAIWEDWLQFPSGVMQEYFTKWGAGPDHHFTGNDWTYRQSFFQAAQQAGKIFLGLTYAPPGDVRSMRYARATFLMDWNGGSSAVIFEPVAANWSGGGDPWSSEWTVDIGTPSGPKFAVGHGFRRNFTGGTAVINISAAASQTFDLGGTFLLPGGQSVTSVTLQPATALILRSAGGGSGPAQAPAPVQAPVVSAPPAVSGVAQQGQTLTASAGTWSGSSASYAYQWRRCDAAGGACSSIAGATAATHVAVAADVSSTLRVVVTAQNSAGSASATSVQTGVVQAAFSANVFGRATVGSVVGDYGDGESRLSRYTLSQAGAVTRMAVYTDGNGPKGVGAQQVARLLIYAVGPDGNPGALLGSSNGIVVQRGQAPRWVEATMPSPVTLPAGDYFLGLHGGPGTEIMRSYYDVGSGVSRGNNDDAYADGALNPHGPSEHAGTRSYSLVATVTFAPVSTAPPAISGTPRAGQALTTSAGTWTGSPTSYAYQWGRCDAAGGECSSIAGATSPTYVPVTADVGSTLRVAVRATNAGGSTTATSAATVAVAAAVVNAAPANVALPTISGTAQQGQTLTAAVGAWANEPTRFSYRWRRCGTSGGSCSNISGATAPSYVLSSNDVGKTIRVVVTATNQFGSASATSAQTATVAKRTTTSRSLSSAPAAGRVTLASGRKLRGRVHLPAAERWRIARAAKERRPVVTVYRQSARRWVAVARIRTDRAGRFTFARPLPRTARVRVVARFPGGVVAQSPPVAARAS